MILSKIQRWYSFYAFYIYEFFDKGPSKWGSKSKTMITLLVLEMVIIVSISLLWLTNNNSYIEGISNKLWVSFPLACGLYLVNHLILFRNDLWEASYKLFKETSHKTKMQGKIVSLCITMLIPVLYILILVEVGRMNGAW